MLKNYKILIIYFFLSGNIFASDLTIFANAYIFSDSNNSNYNMNLKGQILNSSNASLLFGSSIIDSLRTSKVSVIKNSGNNISLYELFHERKLKYGSIKFGKFALSDSNIYQNEISMGHPFISNNSAPIWGVDFIQQYKIKDLLLSFNFYNGQISSLDKYLWNRDYSVNIQTSYIDEPYIHTKSITLTKKIRKNLFSVKLNHGGIWGGTVDKNGRSTSYSKNLEAFKRIVLIRSGIKNSNDSRPKIANQNGSIDFYLKRNNSVFYYINYFEDGSGKSFKNKLDGLWGFSYIKKNHKWLFEVLKTKNQSGNLHIMGKKSGVDSYYWHDQYVQGWTIDGFSIGNYYISPNNNRKIVYRIGYSLERERWNFKAKFDYMDTYPTYGAKKLPADYRFNKSIDNSFYSHLTYEFKLSNGLSISLESFSKDNQLMFGSKIFWNKIL